MALDHNRLDKASVDVPNELLIRNLRLFENDYLTKAAVMCFHPDPEKYVTNAYIKIGFFADNDADILYQDEIHGSLIMQVEKAMDLIFTKYMKALISYEGIHRKETFFFPKEAFRELLLNAVIHRDYMRPTPIQIRIYEHKIRIWNIGKMPADVPAEKLFEPHSSEPRNPNIANVFFKAGYVESWGRGYKNITEICEFRNAVLPRPEENCGGLAVECLPSQEYLEAERNKGKIATYVPVNDGENRIEPVNEPLNDGENKNEPVNDTINEDEPVNDGENDGENLFLSDKEKEVLRLIKNNPTITAVIMVQNTGFSRPTIERAVKKLKELNLIVRIGGDKGGHWDIIEQSNK